MFALDEDDSKFTSDAGSESKRVSRVLTESNSDDSSDVADVDDAFEDFRKNNIEEDTRIALAII